MDEPTDEATSDDAPASQDTNVAELEAELARLQSARIDPRTNQPISDFQPNPDDPDAAANLELQRNARLFGSAQLASDATQQSREADKARKEANDAALQMAKEANVLPEQQMAYVPPDLYRARQQAVVAAEARANTQKTTIPGGRFEVNGELVNAYGDVIDENGKILQRRHVPITG
jgi:hypothetical protein